MIRGLTLLLALLFSWKSHAQALVEWIDLPAEVSVTNGPTNGMWFTAPSDFVIKALKVPDNTINPYNPQSIAVLKFTGNGASSSPAINYTVLFLVQDTITGDSIPCNINVLAGDHIGIIGSRWDGFSNVGQCSNAGIGNYSTTINGFSTPLYKLNANSPLNNQAPSNVWMPSSTAPIARMEMYYEGCELPTPDSLIIESLACHGDTTGSITAYISGTFSNSVMEWSTGDSNINTINSLAGGSYDLSITSATGCKFDTTITVFEPDSIMTLATFEEPTCYNAATGSILVMASGGTPGYQYQWNTGDTGLNLQGISGGLYTLTITDMNGCSNTKTFELEQPNEVVINIDQIINNPCPDDSTGMIQASIFGGFLPYQASWNDEDSTIGTTISNLPIGNYTLSVSDYYGCTATSSISIIALNENPEIDLGPDLFLPPVGLLQIYGPSGFPTYLWSNGSSLNFISTSTPGIYWLEVTDENTCSGRDTLEVFNSIPSGSTAYSNDEMKVFPNPFNMTITFQIDNIEGEIKIIDTYGRIIFHETIIKPEEIIVNTSQLAPGVYIASYNLNGQGRNVKLIKY